MLTIETERRIAKFLATLSEEELKIRRLKENLVINCDFNPYQCFRTLDKKGKKAIDCYDIYDFLKKNRKYSTLHECFLIILFFDTKDENYWTYENFIKFLLSGYKNYTNSVNYEFPPDKGEDICELVEDLLLKVFLGELDLIRNTFLLVEKIKERYDYDFIDIFKTLTDTSNISKDSLNNFLIRNGINYNDNQLMAIIYRLSLSKNNLVPSYDLKKLLEVGYCDTTKSDLYEAMLNCPRGEIDKGYNKNDSQNRIINIENIIPYPEINFLNHNKEENNFKRIMQNNRKNLCDNNTIQSMNANNNRTFQSYNNYQSTYELNDTHTQYDNENRDRPELSSLSEKEKSMLYSNSVCQHCINSNILLNGSDKKELNQNHTTKKDTNIINNNIFDGREISPSLEELISLAKQRYVALKELEDNNIDVIPEEKYFVDYLKFVLGNEILIEKTKCELALRADFNIEDCIKIFISQQENNEFITEDDFIFGTQCLDLKFDSSEARLFFCKYDLMSLGYLPLSDFFDMIVPFNAEFREMVENRKPTVFVPKYRSDSIFVGATKLYLQNLLQCICVSETNIEKERHKLWNFLNTISLDKIFYKIDRDKKGYITPMDLGEYLKQSNATLLVSDSDLLFIRLDRDRNGIVTLEDIKTETSVVFQNLLNNKLSN